jgi:hypothetical protein
MAEVRVEQELPAAADAVWKVVRDFGGIGSWSPSVTSCQVEGSGVGAVRTIRAGEALIRERLESFDEAGRCFSYRVLEGTLPVSDFLGRISIASAGGTRSRILWTAAFEAPGLSPERVRELAGGIESSFRRVIGNLRASLA